MPPTATAKDQAEPRAISRGLHFNAGRQDQEKDAEVDDRVDDGAIGDAGEHGHLYGEWRDDDAQYHAARDLADQRRLAEAQRNLATDPRRHEAAAGAETCPSWSGLLGGLGRRPVGPRGPL